MLTPQARFRFKTNTQIGRPPEDDVAPVGARPPREVERLVYENGLISVARQKFSVGRRLSGQHVAVRIEGKLMHVFHDGELIKSQPRQSDKEVTHVKANRPYRKRNKSA
jgi:hypothetical protein